MRYQDIKRLVDDLFRQFLRTIDKRLRKIEAREVKIRMGKYGGDIPDTFGPAYLFDRSLQIYKVNVKAVETDGETAAYTFALTAGTVTTSDIDDQSDEPYFLDTPLKWLKGESLKVDVTEKENLEEFEIVLTAREV